MENVIKKLESLKTMRCIKSAISLSHITLSTLSQDNTSEATKIKARIQEFVGDIYMEQSEHTIALGYFRQSLVTATTIISTKKVNDTNPQYKLKYKISLCLISLKDAFGAMKELESIPIPRRDIATWMELGKLYSITSMKRQAISAYKSVLTIANYVLEAVEALIELGVPVNEVHALCQVSGVSLSQNTAPVNTTTNVSQKGNGNVSDSVGTTATAAAALTGTFLSPEWYKSLITLMSHRHSGDYSKCLETFQNMKTVRVPPLVNTSSRPPNGTTDGNIAGGQNLGINSTKHVSFMANQKDNISDKLNQINAPTGVSDLILSNNIHTNLYVLSEMAYVAFMSDKIDDAYVLFKTIRRINPLYTHQMDYFGELLFYKHDETELNKLAMDMLSLNNQSPVGWLILSMWSELKRETDKALAFVDKAIRCNPSYGNSVRLKGQIILHRKLPDKSLTCFYQANSLQKDIFSYIGIIEANLDAGNHRQAWQAAQETLELFPQCPSALLAVGKALCKSEGKFEEGLHLIAKVCKLNPSSKQAVSILAELYIAKGYYTEALTLLNSSLKFGSSSQLHLLVGKCLIATQRYGEASESLQTSMSLAAREGTSATPAVEEMERLEMILRQRQNANTNSGNHGDTHEYDDSDMQQEEEHEEDGTYDNEEDEDDNFQDVDEGHLHNPNPNSSVIDHDGDNMDEAMMVTSNSRFLQDDFDDEADFNDGDEHEFHDLADQSFDFSISQQHIYAPAHTGTMNSTAGAGNNISAISARSIQQSGSTQYPQFTSPSQRRY